MTTASAWIICSGFEGGESLRFTTTSLSHQCAASLGVILRLSVWALDLDTPSYSDLNDVIELMCSRRNGTVFHYPCAGGPRQTIWSKYHLLVLLIAQCILNEMTGWHILSRNLP